MNQPLIPVILSGGSGTRLWPLSRELFPKQLLPLVTERSLLQETLLRTRGLDDSLGAPIVVCNEDHRFLVADQLRAIRCRAQTIVLEPAGRNTAPAVAVAAMLALKESDVVERPMDEQAHAEATPKAGHPQQDDAMLLVLPADHVILDSAAFIAAVRSAVEAAAEGYLVTFGVVPDKPETGYGYLLQGRAHGVRSGSWSRLEKFVEKPDLATAQRYLDSGDYLWNSGMFVLSARRYLDELRRNAPHMVAACETAVANAIVDPDFTRLGSEFLDCPSDSIDYAVMEKAERAAVVPLDAGWSDVGSWPALHEMLDKDADGNVLRGDVVAEGCRNSFISSSRRLVAAVGLDDYVVIETADAVLVMPSSAAQDIKRIVETLKAAGRTQVRSRPNSE